jgi:broad specificity phosphatase PhoE
MPHRSAAPRAQLALVRHGRSAYVHDGSWVDHVSARRFIEQYDAAPIRDDEAPPPALLELARSADVVIASDLLRAVMSARVLTPDWEPITSPLLRELSFDLPAWGPRLPASLWDGFDYLAWTYRLRSGRDNVEIRRARRAAHWLEATVAEASLSIVVTHGGFRRLLAAELVRRGWSYETRIRRYHNWSTWTLSRPGPLVLSAGDRRR